MVGAPGVPAWIVTVMVPLVKLACVPLLESVPLTVKLKLPVEVGVPVTAPALESESPGGRTPLATLVANVYGA